VPFAAVWIETGASTTPAFPAFSPVWQVANTGGSGANLRSQPGTEAPPVKLLAEGTSVTGAAHAWRQVSEANGTSGWVADEFLAPTRSD
jgi:SH3-like domain-containing protein